MNTFLDSFWPKEPKKIGPMRIEHTDLLRAVNRQPWLPRGMTRRALSILLRIIPAAKMKP